MELLCSETVYLSVPVAEKADNRERFYAFGPPLLEKKGAKLDGPLL